MPTWKDYYKKTYEVEPDDAVSTYLDSGPVYPNKAEKAENEVDPEETEGKEEKKNFFDSTPKSVTSKNSVNIEAAGVGGKNSKSISFNTGRPGKRSNEI